ncbi:hypothetical protein Droror1_Dr00011483, partial [Drosera rotundifolia]
DHEHMDPHWSVRSEAKWRPQHERTTEQQSFFFLASGLNRYGSISVWELVGLGSQSDSISHDSQTLLK